MADTNWGIKIYCECGAKYYSMNKKDKITCPTCSAEYVPEDLNARTVPTPTPKPEPKKKDDIENQFEKVVLNIIKSSGLNEENSKLKKKG